MRTGLISLGGAGLAMALAAAAPSSAQQAPAVDPATIAMPDLAFTPDEDAIRDYRKYFYFHRADTDFATAYADLRDCDRYSGGVHYMTGYVAPNANQGGLLFGLIAGSERSTVASGAVVTALQRRLRRTNMRTCMEFKGYATYGLPKALWLQFNFDERRESVEGAERQRHLQLQARVASGPAPRVGRLDQ